MAKPTLDKLNEYCTSLPDCCVSFLKETGLTLALSTRISYATELSAFFEYLTVHSPAFADKNPADLRAQEIAMITPHDISRYLVLCKDQNEKERTVARKRASLSSFFTYLVKNKYVDINPVLSSPSVKIPKSDEVIFLNMEEQKKFLDTVSSANGMSKRQQTFHESYEKRDLALITLLLDTGIRVSECSSINIKDIDFNKCSASITRKGGNIQIIYFSDEVSELITSYLEERRIKNGKVLEDEPLFVTNKGDRLAVRSIQALVKKYTTAAIPGKGAALSPHKMRSSFAMEFYSSTKDILALQRKLGHKNIQTTNIYAKATDEQMAEMRGILSEKRNNTK